MASKFLDFTNGMFGEFPEDMSEDDMQAAATRLEGGDYTGFDMLGWLDGLNDVAKDLLDAPVAETGPMAAVSNRDVLELGLSVTPGVGEAMDIAYTGAALQKGEYGEAAFNAGLTAIPLISVGTIKTLERIRKKGIEAWHASPRSFDAFDSRYNRTGEGANAFGPGHYVAEHKGTRDAYHESFKTRMTGANSTIGGKPINDLFGKDPINEFAIELFNEAQGDMTKARRLLQDQNKELRGIMRNMEGQQLANAEKRLKYNDAIMNRLNDFENQSKKLGPIKTDPYKYKVELAGPRSDYLKREGLLEANPKMVEASQRITNKDGVQISKILEKRSMETGEPITGQDFYNALRVELGSEGAAKAAMEAQGIKGIEYKDAFTRSRQTRMPSSNFVVFNDKNIKILEKFGIGGLAVGVGAAMYPKDAKAIFIGDDERGKQLFNNKTRANAEYMWQTHGIAYNEDFGGYITEVSDDEMALKVDNFDMGVMNLKDFVEHDKLWKLRPYFSEVQLVLGDKGGDLGNAHPGKMERASEYIGHNQKAFKELLFNEKLKGYDQNKPYIYLNIPAIRASAERKGIPFEQRLKQTLIHEMQHIVQFKEWPEETWQRVIAEANQKRKKGFDENAIYHTQPHEMQGHETGDRQGKTDIDRRLDMPETAKRR